MTTNYNKSLLFFILFILSEWNSNGTILSCDGRMRVSVRLAWLGVLLAACGRSDPKHQLEKIDSAAAMTALTSAELQAHHVSRHYARATLRVLRDEVQQYASDEKATPEVKAHADSALRAIDLALPATESR